MPKASERLSHFEAISNENLIKYIQGSPISLVSGKPIKFGSHEHQHQMRAIRKVMLKRKLADHKAEKCVSFKEDSKIEEVRKPTRKNVVKSLVFDVEEAASQLKKTVPPIHDPLQEIVMKSSEALPMRHFPPIPQESIINSANAMKSNESECIPSHLMHSFISTQNKSFY